MSTIREQAEQLYEIWRPISDYQGFYEVSNYGNVRGLQFYTRYGTIGTRRQPRLVKQKVDNGYARVQLAKGTYRKLYKVHRLVLLAFIGRPSPGLESAHINGDRLDNRVSNLIWATSAENEAHKLLHGTATIGEKNPKAKLTATQVKKMRALHGRGVSFSELGRIYGVSNQSARRTVLRENWKSVL